MNTLMTKRFVIFDGTLMQGGAERVISILSKKMIENGLDVQILLYHDRPIFYEIDSRVTITVVERETHTSNIIKNALWIRKFFENNADIVISFLAPFNILALLAHIGLKSKIIVADRNDPRYVPSKFVIRKLRDFLYHLADGVVLQTKHNQDYFDKVIRKKSIIIYNPINLNGKAGLALQTKKQKQIVSVGRLMPQKNQEMLLIAFAKLHKAHPDYKLIIYGEGPYRENLEKRIQELQLSECVNLPGSSKKVFDDIACAQLFVLSSNYEGMPNALIEAMCLGLPCISTRVSGATDLIKDGYNGYLVEVGNIEELSDKMEKLLADESLRIKFAKSSVSLNDDLSIDIIMKQWLKYLLQMF